MTDTTPTAEAGKLAMLNAICRGLNAAEDDSPFVIGYGDNGTDYTNRYADAIYANIKTQLTEALTTGITAAFEAPEFLDKFTKALLPEIFIELADDFDQIHDNPKTPDNQRPGLRRANRHLRQLRNEAKDAQ